MDKIPNEPRLPWYRNWHRWLGFTLLAAVVVAIAQPVGQFIELFCALSHMGPS
jgi:hypothetical protein